LLNSYKINRLIGIHKTNLQSTCKQIVISVLLNLHGKPLCYG
jgi:hypothetical protein